MKAMSREEAVEKMRHLAEMWEIKATQLSNRAEFSDDVAKAQTLRICSQELITLAVEILK